MRWTQRWTRQRSRRGWERGLLREIRALDTAESGHDVAPVPPVPRRRAPRRPGRGPRRLRGPRRAGGERHGGDRTRTWWTLAVTVVVVIAMGVVSLGPAAVVVRGLVGLGPVGGGNGHDYAFIGYDSFGRPAGFSPCKDIHYEVNPSQAPPGWEGIVHDSVAAVSRATGLTFVDDGTTGDDDYFNRRNTLTDSPEPVLIGWTTSDRVHDLDGDVAGVTSSDFNPSSGHYDTGRVVLDADAYRALEMEPQGEREERAILMHELGHLVGLAHVDATDELMYPTVGSRFTFGSGDLTGLAKLGAVHC